MRIYILPGKMKRAEVLARIAADPAEIEKKYEELDKAYGEMFLELCKTKGRLQDLEESKGSEELKRIYREMIIEQYRTQKGLQALEGICKKGTQGR